MSYKIQIWRTMSTFFCCPPKAPPTYSQPRSGLNSHRSMLGRKAVAISSRVLAVATQEHTDETTERKSSRSLAVRQRSPFTRTRPLPRTHKPNPNERRLQRHTLRHSNLRQRTMDVTGKYPIPAPLAPRRATRDPQATRTICSPSTLQTRLWKRSDSPPSPVDAEQ